MRILFVTSRVPYPPFRGDKLKIFNLIRNISQHHEVRLVTFYGNEADTANLPPLKQYCASVRGVRHPLWKSLAGGAGGIVSANPIQVEWYRSRAMTEALAEEMSSTSFDVVHTHLIRLAQYTRGWNQIPRVLDLTDAVSLYLHRFMETERNPVKRLGLRVERDRMRAYEQVLREFDCSLVCSETDRTELRRNVPGARIELLENGVDLEYFAPAPDVVPRPRSVIFTGNMSYFPNEDAARYFVSSIWPRIRREVPDVTLSIVGQNPPSSVRSLAGPGIVVTGTVPDIRAQYVRHAIAVSPVRYGAGTLNKVLEPMALGIPVVASGIGMAGIPLNAGEHYLLGETQDAFADAVVRLLKNPGMASDIGSNAMNFVRANYGWVTIAGRLAGYYEEVVDRHKNSASSGRKA
jgi:sugar transferase (PEP-CTERM/EpsH1 system associated)